MHPPVCNELIAPWPVLALVHDGINSDGVDGA